jgi:hypothetical protein
VTAHPAQALRCIGTAELLGALVPAPRLLGVGLDCAHAQSRELLGVEPARERHGASIRRKRRKTCRILCFKANSWRGHGSYVALVSAADAAPCSVAAPPSLFSLRCGCTFGNYDGQCHTCTIGRAMRKGPTPVGIFMINPCKSLVYNYGSSSMRNSVDCNLSDEEWRKARLPVPLCVDAVVDLDGLGAAALSLKS